MYHSITQEIVRDPGQMTTPLALFEEHLRILRDGGYVVRDALWLAERVGAGGDIPRRTVVVTFDDGLRDLHDLAAPTLERFGVRATGFLIGAALTGDFHRLPRIWPGGYLTLEQAQRLARGGVVDLGAHGLTHRPVARLNPVALREETMVARETVAELVGVDVSLYAYPRGAPLTWNRRAERAVAAAGYRGAFTSVARGVGPREHPYAIPRSRMSWADGPSSFEMMLRGCFDWYSVVQEFQARVALLRGRSAIANPQRTAST